MFTWNCITFVRQNALYLCNVCQSSHLFQFVIFGFCFDFWFHEFHEVVSFKLAALRKPFEARDDLTLTMKIARASQRRKTGVTGALTRHSGRHRGQGCSQWVAQGYTRGCRLCCIRTPQQGELRRFGRSFWGRLKVEWGRMSFVGHFQPRT